MGSIWFWYLIFVVLIGIWANNKNRNGLGWSFIAILISPLIAGFILLFLEKKEDIQEKSLYCSNCKTEVSEEAEFCPKCGAKFEQDGVKCSKCKTINDEENKFCQKCGNKL